MPATQPQSSTKLREGKITVLLAALSVLLVVHLATLATLVAVKRLAAA